jgi:hypothetical protein
MLSNWALSRYHLLPPYAARVSPSSPDSHLKPKERAQVKKEREKLARRRSKRGGNRWINLGDAQRPLNPRPYWFRGSPW